MFQSRPSLFFYSSPIFFLGLISRCGTSTTTMLGLVSVKQVICFGLTAVRSNRVQAAQPTHAKPTRGPSNFPKYSGGCLTDRRGDSAAAIRSVCCWLHGEAREIVRSNLSNPSSFGACSSFGSMVELWSKHSETLN